MSANRPGDGTGRAVRPDEDERPPRFRSISSAAVLSSLFLTAMFALFALTCWNQWRAELGKADSLARALAAAAAEQTGGSLRTIDLLIQHVGNYLQTNKVRPLPEVIASFNIHSRSFPEMADLMIVDASGSGRSIEHNQTIDVSGRAFFTTQASLFRANAVVLDGPTRDPVSGEWQIVLSRPLLDKRGRFDGVVAAVLRPSFFADPLKSIGDSTRGGVLLVNVKGVVFGGQPNRDHRIGTSLPTGVLPPAEPDREVWGSVPVGSAVDAEPMISAYHAVARYPLIVFASLPVAAVKEAWWDGVWRAGAIVGFVGLVAVILAVMFDRRDAERRRAARQLKRLNEELEQRVVDRTRSLEQVKEAYENLFDGAIEGILIHRQFRPMLANLSCARLFGFDGIDEFLTVSNVLDLVQPEFHPLLLEATDGALATQSPVTIEFEARHRKGGQLWCRHSIRAVEWKGGQALQSSFVNITASKSWQSRLSAAKEAAEAASELKSRFLAVACHDLRQPVQALAFYVNLLSRRLGARTAFPRDGEEDEIVRRIGESTVSLSELLDSLLDMSKLEAGGVKSRPRPVNLHDLLEQLWHVYSPTAEELRVSLTIIPSSCHVLSDPVLLERILQNLITNALRYTPAEGKVLVGVRRHHDEVRLQVIDTGQGIPDDMLPRVFEEFFRLDSAPPQAGRGVGLGVGLAIVKRLCHLLGHDLSVRSRLGHGTSFTLTLGRADETLPAAPASRGPETMPPGRRVLVIENDPMLRDGIVMQLTDWGVEARGVASGAQAVAVARDWPVDLILCDYRLNYGETGEAVVAALAASLGRSFPVIMLTAETAPLSGDPPTPFRLLHKPVLPEVLHAVLAEELGAGEAKAAARDAGEAALDAVTANGG